jgi:hypothetical protein
MPSLPFANLTDDMIKHLLPGQGALQDAMRLLEAGGGGEEGAESFNVITYGAVGDGVTDDREAVQAAIDAATASAGGSVVTFPSGSTFLIGGYVDIDGANNLKITGYGAILHYPSDDVSIVADAVATTNERARSALFMHGGCTGVIVEGLTFQGGTANQLQTINIGCGIYNTDGTGLTIIACKQFDGSSLLAEDTTAEGTNVLFCRSERARGSARLGKKGSFVSCYFGHSTDYDDVVGQGMQFTTDGDEVTLRCNAGRFTAAMEGKYIKVFDSTTADNDGLFLINEVVDANNLTFTNSLGVDELFPGHWWIPNGDQFAGIGAGLTAIAVAGSTVTLTTSAAHGLTAADVGAAVRLADATTAANNGHFLIESVPSTTTLTFTNASAVAETFAGIVTVDGYDNIHNAAGTAVYGSTHAIYFFAGREDNQVVNCVFEGLRANCVKISGSSSPIRNITVKGCAAYQCATFSTAGADDAQEHVNLTLIDNTIVDCGTGRPGWSDSTGITIMGSRGTRVESNTFYYTRNCVKYMSTGGSAAGVGGILALRYLNGRSQPLESIIIERNQFRADPRQTTPGMVLDIAISVSDVGIRNKWGSDATIAHSGTTSTLTSATGIFSSQDVGSRISIRFGANAANRISDVAIVSVPSSTTLTFTNALGVTDAVATNTYRIRPPATVGGGVCRIVENSDDGVAAITVQSASNVGPEIRGNTWNRGGSILVNGCVAPRITDSREVGAFSSNARIRLASGTSWPIVDNNVITNPSTANSFDGASAYTTLQRGMGIGVDSATKVDYPLLGVRGRCLSTGGLAQLMMSYGSRLVDGDSFQINGTTLTYKSSGAGAGQFDRFSGAATGLVERVSALANVIAADYGAQFSVAVTTQHLLIKGEAVTDTVDLYYIDNIHVLNPTALVIPRNGVGGGEAIQYSRGERDGASAATKTVFWSQCAALEAGGSLVASNAGGAALLADPLGYYSFTSITNDGVCQTFIHAAAAGTEEFRVRL